MLKLAGGLTWLVRIALFVSAMLGLVMSLLVFSAVFMRYILSSPLHFSDELVALLFSACVFLTIPYTFAMNFSIRVTLIADHLSERARRITDGLANLGCIGFFLIFGYLSYEVHELFPADRRALRCRPPALRRGMALMPISSFLTALIIVGESDPGQPLDPARHGRGTPRGRGRMIWVILICGLALTGLIGLPVGIGLGLIGLAILHFLVGDAMSLSITAVWNTFNDFILSAVPMFIFMGEILLASGVSRRLYIAAAPLFHGVPGGLLHTNIAVCTLFGAVSGASTSTAAAVGSVAYPELKRRGYRPSTWSARSLQAGRWACSFPRA